MAVLSPDAPARLDAAGGYKSPGVSAAKALDVAEECGVTFREAAAALRVRGAERPVEAGEGWRYRRAA